MIYSNLKSNKNIENDKEYFESLKTNRKVVYQNPYAASECDNENQNRSRTIDNILNGIFIVTGLGVAIFTFSKLRKRKTNNKNKSKNIIKQSPLQLDNKVCDVEFEIIN